MLEFEIANVMHSSMPVEYSFKQIWNTTLCYQIFIISFCFLLASLYVCLHSLELRQRPIQCYIFWINNSWMKLKTKSWIYYRFKCKTRRPHIPQWLNRKCNACLRLLYQSFGIASYVLFKAMSLKNWMVCIRLLVG